MNNPNHAGFWIRVGASLIDSILLMLVLAPLLTTIYGGDYWTSDTLLQGPVDFTINHIAPAVAILLFWIYRSATPGKMMLGLKIVDAETGGKPSTGKLIGRYLGYYLAIPTLMISILWVAWDKRKQGLHDKLAGTLVIRRERRKSASDVAPVADTSSAE